MDFLPDEEQAQIIETVRNYLATEHPVSKVQEVSDDTRLTNPGQWTEMGELGWFGIGLSDEFGGAGFSVAEETLVFIEAGKYLVSPSLLATVLGARVAAYGGDHSLAERIICGESVVALAFSNGEFQWQEGRVRGDFQAFETDVAQHLLLADQYGAGLFEVNGDLALTTRQCLDEKVQLSTAVLDGARSAIFLPASEQDIYSRGILLSAAFLVGIAEEVKTRSVDYAKEREQFGQAIGSFQAIKHKCSDMALRCEAALSTTVQACLGFQSGTTDAAFDIMSAKILAAEAAIVNAADSIQIHGAMGFTEEMPIHLFYKRAQLMSQVFGRNQALLSDIVNFPMPVQ